VSRLYEALSRMRVNPAPLETSSRVLGGSVREISENEKRATELTFGEPVMLSVTEESRLVTLTARNSLGADKFRALVNRLTRVREKERLRSIQVTSSGVGEGKTVVAANLALTFAKHARSRTLLVEGDLHRPAIAANFGLLRLPGLLDWWSSPGSGLASYVRRVQGASLWILTAGCARVQPSELLASGRFRQSFAEIAEQFDWVVVDSPPMSPVVDVNLWARLVDGAILVVREGVTPIQRLKKGLATLDEPKLIGVVRNGASDLEGEDYESRFYSDTRGPLS